MTKKDRTIPSCKTFLQKVDKMTKISKMIIQR